MPKVKLYDMTGKELGTKDLSEAVFGIEPNMAVLHEAVKNFLANQRQGTQSTLTRTEVAGGGRKPWRQKGTGHARQGSTRAPHWRHGGVALGPKPRDYSYALNRKVKKLAFRSAFSAKVKENEMMVIDQITMDEYKTKDIVKLLNALGVEKKALIVLPVLRPLWLAPSMYMTSSTTTTSSLPLRQWINLRRCTHNESSPGHHSAPCNYRSFHRWYCRPQVHF